MFSRLVAIGRSSGSAVFSGITVLEGDGNLRHCLASDESASTRSAARSRRRRLLCRPVPSLRTRSSLPTSSASTARRHRGVTRRPLRCPQRALERLVVLSPNVLEERQSRIPVRSETAGSSYYGKIMPTSVRALGRAMHLGRCRWPGDRARREASPPRDLARDRWDETADDAARRGPEARRRRGPGHGPLSGDREDRRPPLIRVSKRRTGEPDEQGEDLVTRNEKLGGGSSHLLRSST